MKRKKIFTIIFIISWFSLLAYAHGLKFEIEKHPPCVLVTAVYHGGKTLTNAAVTVFFNDLEQEFQKGLTDKNGRFSFIPDKAGTWFFQADDGMGHRKKIRIEIGAGFFQSKAAAKKNNTAGVVEPAAADEGPQGVTKRSLKKTSESCIYCKVLLGVVLIFAFTFILYTWKKKGENKKQA